MWTIVKLYCVYFFFFIEVMTYQKDEGWYWCETFHIDKCQHRWHVPIACTNKTHTRRSHNMHTQAAECRNSNHHWNYPCTKCKQLIAEGLWNRDKIRYFLVGKFSVIKMHVWYVRLQWHSMPTFRFVRVLPNRPYWPAHKWPSPMAMRYKWHEANSYTVHAALRSWNLDNSWKMRKFTL